MAFCTRSFIRKLENFSPVSLVKTAADIADVHIEIILRDPFQRQIRIAVMFLDIVDEFGDKRTVLPGTEGGNRSNPLEIVQDQIRDPGGIFFR